MEPNRQKDPMTFTLRRQQAGVTVIGFLVLASVFGVIGFAGIKIVPLYAKKLALTTVLSQVKDELDGEGPTPQAIRVSLEKRFDVEGMTIPREEIKISQTGRGYRVRIQREEKTPFVADLWFLVEFDKQVEIRR